MVTILDMSSRKADRGGWWVWLAAFLPVTVFVAVIGSMMDPALPADSMKRATVLVGLGVIDLLAVASVERWLRHQLTRSRDPHPVG